MLPEHGRQAYVALVLAWFFASTQCLATEAVVAAAVCVSHKANASNTNMFALLLQNNPPAELAPVQEMYNHRAIQLSLLVACMYTAVGVFNLGFLTNFLSHSVIGGFTSGAAISK